MSHRHKRFFATAEKIKATKRKLKNAEEREEAEDPYDMNYWSEKLGLTGADAEKNSKKLRKEFADDGFDDDFMDMLDGLDDLIKGEAPAESEDDSDGGSEDAALASEPSAPVTSLTGLVNRLSEGNIDGITRELSTALLSADSPNHVASLLVESACGPSVSTLTLLGTYAGCVSALTILNGEAFGYAVVLKAKEMLKTSTDPKTVSNAVKFLSLLYAFGLLPDTAMTACVQHLLTTPSIESLDLIVNLFRFAGKAWRAAFPNNFNSAVDAAISGSKIISDGGKRLEFIVSEMQLFRAGKSSFAVMTHFEQVSSWLATSTLLQGRRVSSASLRIDGNLFADDWVQGNALKMRQKPSGMDKLDRLEEMASAQRMNTETKKRMFVALMGAASPADAVERMASAVVKSKDWVDAAGVLVHCAIREASPNKYYSVVAGDILRRHGPKFSQALKKCLATEMVKCTGYADSALRCLSALIGVSVQAGVCDLGILRFSNFYKSSDREKLETLLVRPLLQSLPASARVMPQDKYPDLAAALTSCL
jgi:hypothetical protein